MDLSKFIAKARPGSLGGKHEEKRPLRQLSKLPVKRHIFINRDSHPERIFMSRYTKPKTCGRRSPIIKCRIATTPTNSIILSATVPT